jgi:hypothetical protein
MRSNKRYPWSGTYFNTGYLNFVFRQWLYSFLKRSFQDYLNSLFFWKIKEKYPSKWRSIMFAVIYVLSHFRSSFKILWAF